MTTVTADRIRHITTLLNPPPVTTRVCATCGQPDGVLISTGFGNWVHVNPDRCDR